MEVLINKNDYVKLVSFNSKDFEKYRDEINNGMNRVSSSFEYSNDNHDQDKALEVLNKWNENFFEREDTNGKIYFLYIKNDEGVLLPMAYAMYSKSDRPNAYHLEFISVHNDYTSCGYGEWLLKKSAQDLAKQDVKEITCTINNQNIASLHMHDNFAKKNNLELYRNNLGFGQEWVFDITPLKKNKVTETDMIL